MLNGLAPLIIFNFPVIPPELKNAIAGIPLIGDFLATNVGIPIPIYLDAKLTGIEIQNEVKAIDIETNPQALTTGAQPVVNQQTLDNRVTVNMVAQKDNIMATVLGALCDQIFTRVVSKSYGLSYLNGSTAIFGGLLAGFTSEVGTDDDLIRMTMIISKATSKGPTPDVNTPIVTATTGAIPS